MEARVQSPNDRSRKKEQRAVTMFNLNLAGCELDEASVNASVEGGVTYSVICNSIADEMLARLIHAAESGNTIRVQFGRADG